ncbi:MAG TPA: HEAT repeat domain-containing protein, partial [Gemmatimonadales bacterium]
FVRVRIASALAQFDGPEIVDRLVRALGDSAWWVRMRGVEALEQIGPIAEGPLLLALSDSDPEIRKRAAISLERIGVPAALVDRIERDDRADEASNILGRLAAAGTRELVAELLSHPFPRVRGIVLSALSEADRSDLTPELVDTASRPGEPALRAQALGTLQRLRAIPPLPVVAKAASDPSPDVRVAAVGLLGGIGDRRALGILRSRLDDSEPVVRAAAITALGERAGSGVEPDVLRLLSDPEPAVREAAVTAAGRAAFRSLCPAVVERLTDEDERVRRAAAIAMGHLGDGSVVPALITAFDHAPPDLRPALTQAIARLDPAALSQLLTSLVERDDPASRLALAETLGRTRPRGGWEHLIRLAEDDDPAVRAAAIMGLGRSGRHAPPPATLVPMLARSLRDSAEAVRARSVETCGRLCLEDHWRTLIAMLQDDPSALVRERAALAIGTMRAPGGETPLTAACHRPEPLQVRAAAALAAGSYDRSSLVTLILEMPDETAVRRLLRQRMKEDPWFRLLRRGLPRTSGVELRAVAAGSPAEAQASLADGLRSVLDASERVRLITGLRSFQGEGSRAALLQLVRSDPSAEVRAAALTAVAELLDPDELLAFGTRGLGDPSILVRRAAIQMFGRVPPERAFLRLIPTLQENDDPTVLAAVGGLAQAHFSSFRNAGLSPQLQAEHGTVVAQLARYIHHPELPTLLSALARQPDPGMREAVAEVWRHRPDATEPAALEGLTADPVLAVRRLAAGAAVSAERYDLLDRMTQDPEVEVRREVAVMLGLAAPVGSAGLLVLEHLENDSEMLVRAAAHVARLLQGQALPLPPGLDPRAAAQAVREGADLGALRSVARTAATDERRLAAALALAMIQDDVAHEVARSDPAPTVRHRVGGALELSLRADLGDQV